MTIILALVIVGWLVAFALGAQAGFDSNSVAGNSSAQPSTASAASADAKPYGETASAA